MVKRRPRQTLYKVLPLFICLIVTELLICATIVTTPALEVSQPKVFIYEVSERDGDAPQVKLLKVDDLNLQLDENDRDQPLQDRQEPPLRLTMKNYRNQGKRNTLNNKKSKVSYNDLYNIYNLKENSDYGLSRPLNKNNYKFWKSSDSKYINSRNRKKRNNIRLMDWNVFMNNQDSQEKIWNSEYSNLDNQNTNLEDQLSRNDNQYNIRDNQDIHYDSRYSNRNNQRSQLDDQLKNLVRQYKNQGNQYSNRDNRNQKKERKYQKAPYSEDYADFLNEFQRNKKEPNSLLSQIKSLKRDKRETERKNLIKRVKLLVKRLQQLDIDNEANLGGTVYVTKLDDVRKWDNKEHDNYFAQENRDVNSYQNEILELGLRSGAVEFDDNEDVDALVDERTLPPPKKDIFAHEEYK